MFPLIIDFVLIIEAYVYVLYPMSAVAVWLLLKKGKEAKFV